MMYLVATPRVIKIFFCHNRGIVSIFRSSGTDNELLFRSLDIEPPAVTWENPTGS